MSYLDYKYKHELSIQEIKDEIPGLNIPVKLETDYHDKALYFMPFVKKYAKRKYATNIILKDRIDSILELKKDTKASQCVKKIQVKV